MEYEHTIGFHESRSCDQSLLKVEYGLRDWNYTITTNLKLSSGCLCARREACLQGFWRGWLVMTNVWEGNGQEGEDWYNRQHCLIEQIASLCCNPRKIGMFLNLEQCFRYQDLRMISLSSLIITSCSDKSSTMIAQRNKWKAEQSNFQTLWQAESSQCISACETMSRD